MERVAGKQQGIPRTQQKKDVAISKQGGSGMHPKCKYECSLREYITSLLAIILNGTVM